MTTTTEQTIEQTVADLRKGPLSFFTCAVAANLIESQSRRIAELEAAIDTVKRCTGRKAGEQCDYVRGHACDCHFGGFPDATTTF